MKKETQNWEEEFDKRYYGEIEKLSDTELWKFCRSDFPKQIVRQLLAQQKKELIKELLSYCDKSNLVGVCFVINRLTKE